MPLAILKNPVKAIDKAVIKVSCIMPTRGRRHFVGQAIKYFLAQCYQDKELIIVDDAQHTCDAVADLIPPNTLDNPNIPNIRYFRLPYGQSIGAKRNFANQQALGQVILHWDDDDWMAANWITTALNALLTTKADVTGIQEVFYYQPTTGQAWQYCYPQGQQTWVLGGSLCYLKSFWQRNRFDDINIGEDNAFLWSTASKRIVPHHNSQLYIGMIHSTNTSIKQVRSACWQSVDPQIVRQILHKDKPYYDAFND